MNRLFPIATHLRQRLLDLLGKIGGIPAAAAYSRHRVTAGDHSCVAYAEIHDDETAVTAMAVLRRAVSWFAERDIRVERVLSDNGSACKSHARRDAYAGRFGTGFT